ncbi:protein tyrosine phosphatase family protein [Sphingomonas echinoides]|uniref:Protein tyrosine phosphatase family protein n=1 Tax=Sphingomonas echinoides TaxID=59803 RepID=A0ABU4PK54_9SPHN|nr:protein tyrosine phosphatase family protein [Sphingomonas echinoides]MDX5984349.1 protein tyrosine phosphatase family protein [Sphingomonas echinoides]
MMTDPDTILNWRRFDARITTSGQPSAAQLAEIQALGVTHIINLGLHSHPRALPDEAATVSDLGMRYIHIPVDFDHPTEADFDRFCAVLDALPDTPVHVHCIVNARVTAFLYRYQRDRVGGDASAARALLDTVWQPGGVWADFIGEQALVEAPHRYAGRDYQPVLKR